MRIVIVCDPGHVDGGTPKVAIASARGLADAGELVTYICTVGPVSAELHHPRIEVHCLNYENIWKRRNPLAAAMQGIWNGAAKSALESILAAMPKDETVVHFHQWTKAFSPSVLSVPKHLGLSALVSLHDYFLLCPNGAYYQFPNQAPCTLVPMSTACVVANCDRKSRLHKAVRVARQYATENALAQARESLSILHVSRFARQVVERFIPQHYRQFTLPSPIDIDREARVNVAQNEEFVFVGRMTEEKGVRQLANAAREASLRLTFIGDGPLLEEIRAYGDTIRCTGWLEAAEVQKVLKNARALVFPSTWYETGGLVVLEALARGIPVIVSRTTAAADYVAEGENGFLVDPNDLAALSSQMMALTDDTVAERMGAEAYARYWSNPHTSAAHVAGLREIYHEILASHGPSTTLDIA